MAYQALEGSLLYSPRTSYIAVVAIDFGTTYSGFAFSFVKDQGKDAIFMNKDWANEQGQQTSKTPTCLLLKPDLSFDSFGYEAIEKYSSLQGDGEEKEYLFFNHFKMALHTENTLNTETTIKAANGKFVKAKRVFACSISFLKDEAIKTIQERTGDDCFSVDDIQWVLTVPALWGQRAKQFMREAAYEAKVGSTAKADQLTIALEPEAAAIFCQEKNLNEFQSETGVKSVKGLLAQPDKHYMVVDIGGGTLDVTVHMIEDDGTIKEIHKVTGGPYGGIYVNQRFENLLEEILGRRRLQNYQKQFPSDWLCLMNEFEGKKRGKRILDSGLMTNIRPPRSFVTLVNETGSSALKRYGETEIKLKNNEYLSLSSGMMKRLFSPVVEKIKQHLKTLVRKPELSKVRTMLLVGGFAEAAFLQQEMKLEFSKRGFRVLVPHHATTAVVQGAVMFGKSPTKITERVVATTYGSGCARDFIKGVHPEEKKIIVHGVEKCNNLFKCFIKENERVQCGQKIKLSFSPLYPEEDKIEYSFYISSDPNVKFTTDPEVTKIGRVVVQSPDTWKGKDRNIEVSLCCGGTEITATALDISSGNQAQTTLDFFC